MKNYTRVIVPVSKEELDALRLLATQEMREPRDQARYLLQQELVKRGVLVERNSSTGLILADDGAAVGINP